jgi:4-amino-4-deoxy-L-arabinose transferase-like glycosyltransferase
MLDEPLSAGALHPDDEGGVSPRAVRRLRIAFWAVAISLAILQCWERRFQLWDDGVSYLDIGDAYMRGDFRHALNAYWSPMYSWILGIALRIFHPSGYWESSLVHAVNVVIFLFALAGFEFLLRSVAWPEFREGSPGGVRLRPVWRPAFLVLGYSVFLWATIEWLKVWHENPDLCLSGFLFFAAGVLIRIRAGRAGAAGYAALGALLGLGYLTKGAMFPIAFVFLGAAFLLARRGEHALLRIGVALLAFAIVAGPFVLALSRSKGRPTFGDTGKLAYVWYPNRTSDLVRNWHEMFGGTRSPVHPMRRILQTPAAYEFGFDGQPTYPPWHDPSMWFEGVRARFDLRGQMRALAWSARSLWRMFLGDGYLLLGGAVVLFIVGFTTWNRLAKQISAQWPLLLPAIAAIGMYSLVVVWDRYIAPFAVLLWLGTFAAVRLPDSREGRRVAAGVAVSIVLGMAILWGSNAVSNTRSLVSAVRGRSGSPVNPPYEIARGLAAAGIVPGDRVVKVGYGANAYWARLAGVKIVAEVFSEDEEFDKVPGIRAMFAADGSLLPEARDAFASIRAKAIVASAVPADVARQGWRELGKTGWFVYPLS